MTTPRLQETYNKTIRKNLQEKFNYANPHQVPKIVKVSVNMGLGDAAGDKKQIAAAAKEMGLITGQRPVITIAKKSIAGFKLREGMPIGCKVTLRRKHMYEFLDRLANIALPRVRDFRGLSVKGFDKEGNYTLGLKEHIVFPEIDYDKIDKVRGLDITIVTTATTKEEALALLEEINFPFRNKPKKQEEQQAA